MSASKKTTIVMVFSLVVILAVVLLAQKRPPASVSQREGNLTLAEEGQFPATLPREFVLDSAAAPEENRAVTLGDRELQITANYSLDYGDGVHQSTGNYESQRTLADLAQAYEEFMNDNGWTVDRRTTYPTIRGLYGKKGNTDLSVSIVDKGNIRHVSVSYIER